ncbi:J domain-containing protein [Zavarzinia compransoris]|nr:J domain-containing protein [Zavarzinia compransoris]TDP45144.1 DnaJ-like protein [Zavarzinia compransoris]
MSRKESAYPRQAKGRGDTPPLRPCAVEGCACAGEYRAPRSRNPGDDPLWFCLDHVRDYNRNWNWFEGMGSDEIERYQSQNATWQRPTWKLGERAGGRSAARHYQEQPQAPHDPFDLLGEAGYRIEAGPAPQARRLSPEDRQALAVLELDAGAAAADVKPRYKALVKRYHPDRNGGNKDAEARLRQVIDAYRHLRDKGFMREETIR